VKSSIEVTSPPLARAIATRTHGHVLERVPAGAGPFPLLVGFHGYAQLAEDCFAELAQIPGAERWLLCAVQGLHLFYRARTGEVAASWMTRLGREQAIADNVGYVRAVVDDLTARHRWNGKLVYLGFSQGVAMAFRAAAGCGYPAAGVVALAADVPPEIAQGGVSLPPVLLARGSDDNGYGAAQMEKDLAVLHGLGVAVESFTFAGGHEWTPEFRRWVGDWLREIEAG
jgi:predicted esterase